MEMVLQPQRAAGISGGCRPGPPRPAAAATAATAEMMAMPRAKREHEEMMEAADGAAAEVEAEAELRRGPWTVDEDLTLINYIAEHGEGRWNALARAAGLKRTGKSCRLRWLNYLRPDVKRGDFTADEQLLILDLHSRWGNRWSKIAAQLPGRTDNEIKNYWRTRVQKHAKQLNCDVNSARFKDAMRFLWMPRLAERAAAAQHQHHQQAAAAISGAAAVSTTLITVPEVMTMMMNNENEHARLRPLLRDSSPLPSPLLSAAARDLLAAAAAASPGSSGPAPGAGAPPAMARPPQEAIETFVSITGADEAAAVRALEEHGNDLNGAVNAYFNEGDRSTTRINQNPVPASVDDMELDEPLDPMFNRPLFPRTLGNPFELLGPGFADITAADIFGRGPQVTHPREVRQVPIEVKDTNTQTGSSGQGPVIEDVTGRESFYGPEVHGTVIVDEDDEDLPSTPSAHDPNIPSSTSHPNHFMPSAPPPVNVSDYNNDIEEEMIRAAIEASKREAEGMTNDLNSGETENTSRGRGDDELARAVSLSLETAERERALRQEGMHVADPSPDLSDKEDTEGTSGMNERQGLTTGKVGTSEQTVDGENFQEDIEDDDEQPLVRQRSRRVRGRTTDPVEVVQMADSPPLSPQPHNIQNDHQHNGGFPSEEWGGISSEEHDEAVMLEAAMFGGIPEGAPYPFSFPTRGRSTHYPRVARPPSPALTAQRLLREQQDDEYLAALQADREKELKAVEEAELRRAEEAAAREAALERQKKEEEEKLKKQREEEELESELAAKQASLPKEPLQNDEGAVTVVVRMPDGSRRGRRFLKSDKLQYLFDFIDISRTFKPGTYRLVRSYPRRAFTDGESQMSLSDLGLTSKQEALFLEKISG